MVCFSIELWCPTCGETTADGKDCQSCADWWANNAPPPEGCSCMEIYGEDPACVHHGRDTEWAKENPE